MQILTCVRPWELIRAVAANFTSKAPPSDDARRRLQRRAAKSPLPQIPLTEVQPRVSRAVKDRSRDLFDGQPVRQLVDERGHQVLLHNAPIAQGQFGRVYVGLASDAHHGLQLRMLKKLRIAPAPERHRVESSSLRDLALEIATAQRAQSALAPHHVLLTRSRKSRYKAYLELPAMRGTVDQLLSNASEAQRALLVRAMLTDGLAQLATAHAHGVIHRDIKPENLFFHDTALALGDWGLACFADDAMALAQSAGTPNFAAPEVLNRRVGARGPAMDLWSLGAAALQAALGEDEPWQQAYLSAYDAARDRGEPRDEASDAARAGVKKAHQDYSAWHARREAPASTLPPAQGRFATAFARLDAPLRALLLGMMAPRPTERGAASEHLAALQGSPLALGVADTDALRRLYAAQSSTAQDVEARQRLLQRSAESLQCL